MRADDELLEMHLPTHDMTIPEFQRWAQLKREAWESYISVQLQLRRGIIDAAFTYDRKDK